MSQCPFANLLDPDTYAEGMPYQALREIREAGPVVKMDDPISGVPYWVVTRIADMDCPVLALQGGDDPGIPTEVDDAFSESLAALEVDGEVVVFDGAPHSFFDRKQDEFADASDDAWRRIQAFIERNS